jgi:hypothetical protein
MDKQNYDDPIELKSILTNAEEVAKHWTLFFKIYNYNSKTTN